MSAEINVDMSGKITIVTGSTGGIGKEIARGLARMGATLVLAARNRDKAAATQKELVAETGNQDVSVMILDVSSPASIRTFVDSFAKKHDRLHVLVNNAGVWFTDRHDSPEGRELTFATNVLGPYLLTKLLLDRLRAAAPSRIVNVVSALAANYDGSDLEFERRKYDGFKAYGQSKQALRMLTWGLAERLKESGVTANAAAPGFVKTDFNQNAHGFMATMINLSAKLFAVSAAEGADTPLWAAVAPELESETGKYFDGRKEKDGKFREPGPIAELEAMCEAMVSGVVSGAQRKRAS